MWQVAHSNFRSLHSLQRAAAVPAAGSSQAAAVPAAGSSQAAVAAPAAGVSKAAGTQSMGGEAGSGSESEVWFHTVSKEIFAAELLHTIRAEGIRQFRIRWRESWG